MEGGSKQRQQAAGSGSNGSSGGGKQHTLCQAPWQRHSGSDSRRSSSSSGGASQRRRPACGDRVVATRPSPRALLSTPPPSLSPLSLSLSEGRARTHSQRETTASSSSTSSRPPFASLCAFAGGLLRHPSVPLSLSLSRLTHSNARYRAWPVLTSTCLRGLASARSAHPCSATCARPWTPKSRCLARAARIGSCPPCQSLDARAPAQGGKKRRTGHIKGMSKGRERENGGRQVCVCACGLA